MTDTAHSNQFLGFLYRVFEIFCTVHGKRRRQFFVCKRLAFVDNFHFTDQDFGGCRHSKACQFSDFIRWLTDDSGVQRAIFQDDVLNRFQLFTLQQVAAVAGETFANGIVHGVYNDHRLFRCADHAVIEGFRHQYRRNSTLDISSFVDDYRRVTRTHTDSRFTGAVCCFNHARTTGREDQVNVRVMHQRVRQLNRRLVDPANQIFWCARSDSSLQNDIRSFVGRVFRTWVWREDDCVTGLQADQRFEDGSRGWVGCRNNTANDADRFGDSDSTEGVVFGQHATGFLIFIGVVDILRSEVVFNHFIFNDTHAGFGNGHFSERDSSICSSQCGRAEDFINLFLGEIGIFNALLIMFKLF